MECPNFGGFCVYNDHVGLDNFAFYYTEDGMSLSATRIKKATKTKPAQPRIAFAIYLPLSEPPEEQFTKMFDELVKRISIPKRTASRWRKGAIAKIKGHKP